MAAVQIRSHASLRGIAALLVVGYHLQFGGGTRLAIETATALPSRGYLLVDLFFVLSGFILSHVNGASRRIPLGRSEYLSFLRARVARLYPLHLFCLAYLVLFWVAMNTAYHLLGRAPPLEWTSTETAQLLVQVPLLNAWVEMRGGWNIPTWSISAEMGAYLLFPLVLTARSLWGRGVAVAMAAVPLGFYGSVLVTTGDLDLTSTWGWLRCLAGFLLGMLVFDARHWFARIGTGSLTLLQLVAVGTILVGLALPVPDPLLIPAFALIVAATWPDRGVAAAVLGRRPLLWLGDISYSIYLNHVCLTGVLGFFWARSPLPGMMSPEGARLAWIALVFGVTILVSWWTFERVERPARQWLARRWLGHSAPPISHSPAAP